jgi:hypothetical protein
MVCGKMRMGSQARMAYDMPFMLLATMARSSLSSRQTSCAQAKLRACQYSSPVHKGKGNLQNAGHQLDSNDQERKLFDRNSSGPYSQNTVGKKAEDLFPTSATCIIEESDAMILPVE